MDLRNFGLYVYIFGYNSRVFRQDAKNLNT